MIYVQFQRLLPIFTVPLLLLLKAILRTSVLPSVVAIGLHVGARN